jgi:dUTP pyrophosphatase
MTYWDTERRKFVRQSIMQHNGTPILSDRYEDALKVWPNPVFDKKRADWIAANPDQTLGVNIKLLNDKAKQPIRSNDDDAGLDIYSAESVILESRFSGQDTENDPSRAMISTGVSFELPQGLGLFVWDRSGLSAKHGIHRVAGVLDSSFRGELKIALVNLSNKAYTIKVGDRIAQAIIAPIILAKLIPVSELSETSRGQGGFGSTGK